MKQRQPRHNNDQEQALEWEGPPAVGKFLQQSRKAGALALIRVRHLSVKVQNDFGSNPFKFNRLRLPGCAGLQPEERSHTPAPVLLPISPNSASSPGVPRQSAPFAGA